ASTSAGSSACATAARCRLRRQAAADLPTRSALRFDSTIATQGIIPSPARAAPAGGRVVAYEEDRPLASHPPLAAAGWWSFASDATAYGEGNVGRKARAAAPSFDQLVGAL